MQYSTIFIQCQNLCGAMRPYHSFDGDHSPKELTLPPLLFAVIVKTIRVGESTTTNAWSTYLHAVPHPHPLTVRSLLPLHHARRGGVRSSSDPSQLRNAFGPILQVGLPRRGNIGYPAIRDRASKQYRQVAL